MVLDGIGKLGNENSDVVKFRKHVCCGHFEKYNKHMNETVRIENLQFHNYRTLCMCLQVLYPRNKNQSTKSSIVNRAWFMAHGSGLKAHGSCLKARGSMLMAHGRENLARGPGAWGTPLHLLLGHQARALSHEPLGLSLEPLTMEHSPFVID